MKHLTFTLFSFLGVILPSIFALECSNLQLPTLVPNYTLKGEISVLGGMDTYTTGNKNASKALIAIFDIYGFNAGTNIPQICDRLAEYGYLVVMPDVFHGEQWRREHYPAPKDDEYKKFIETRASWEEGIREDIHDLIEELKNTTDAVEFGIFGFCFGGKIVAQALDENAADIKVGGMFHPSRVDIMDATRIKNPAILLPGSNDPNMTDYCTIINILNGPGSCIYHHFTDVTHGYAGSQGDWNNPLIKQRAQEALGMFEQFLCAKLPPI